MKSKTLYAPLLTGLMLALILVPRLRTQSNPTPPPDLLQTVQALDTQLFDAYNRCDLPKFGSLLAEDLEFYHDVTGLARGRASIVEAIKNNICGKVTRELVPGTLEVYPIANYGAVEMGVHRFHHPGQPDNIGEAKFMHLWQNKDGVWQLTRVFSFDHHPLSK
jgi:Domain of unknown function (DUF4440)